ncbi:MAG: hypothetical protein HYZ63_01735 [Candidatus Andersenbacteria bacterium]|nr:hypothetical protein [Candidatus Andersenbacteria bacterium]
MMDYIMKFFTSSEPRRAATDFSDFFRSASVKDKEKLLTEVLRDANKDQRDLVERHRRLFAK